MLRSVIVGNVRPHHQNGGPALILETGGIYHYNGADSRVENQTPFVFVSELGKEACGVIKIIK